MTAPPTLVLQDGFLGRSAGDGDHVIREGVRLLFNGQPSEPLAQWLEGRGVEA